MPAKSGSGEEAVAHLPFKLHRGFAIVVRGSIGNARNLNFLLDTGASPSVVDRRVAQKLHLQVSSGQLSTFTQKVAVDQSVAADIHLGPFHADQLKSPCTRPLCPGGDPGCACRCHGWVRLPEARTLYHRLPFTEPSSLVPSIRSSKPFLMPTACRT